jgi:hypothetical protein
LAPPATFAPAPSTPFLLNCGLIVHHVFRKVSNETHSPNKGRKNKNKQIAGAQSEPQIRLVKIRNHDANFSLETSWFLRRKCPPYTALSYHCGQQKTHESADGVRHEIHANLAEAFPGLARGTGWFWVDSVSIDQENTEEKAPQIVRMT